MMITMRAPLLLLLAALPLVLLPYLSFVGASSSGDSHDDSIVLLRGLKSNNKVNVIVEFTTEKGKQDALDIGKQKVYYESKLFNVLAMEIHSKDLDRLKRNPDIVSVTLDETIQSIRPPEETINTEEKKKSVNDEVERKPSSAGASDETSTEEADSSTSTESVSTDSETSISTDERESVSTDSISSTDEKQPAAVRQRKNKSTRELVESIPWGVRAVQAEVVPGPDADDIKVCIIDTGYDVNHFDLPGRGVVTGTNSRQYSSKEGFRWDADGDGHGTHIAGTIMAIGNNGQGVVGVVRNPPSGGIKLHVTKGLDDEGSGTISNVIEMVEACVAADADVINMSFVPSSGGGFDTAFNDILEIAYTRYNTLLVAAAGNDGGTAFAYPASYRSVMSVAAVGNGAGFPIAPFSQHNSRVEIAAPGVDIVSTKPGNRIDDSSGTSQATPHVAGVAALVWSYDRTCTAEQIRRILLASASPANGGCNQYYGRGMVRAKAAVDLLLAGGCNAGNIGAFDPSNVCANYQPFTLPQPTPRPTPRPTPSQSASPTALPTTLPTNLPTVAPVEAPACADAYEEWVDCVRDQNECFGCLSLPQGGGRLQPGAICDSFIEWFPENEKCCNECSDILDDFKTCKECQLPTLSPTAQPTTLQPTLEPTIPPTDIPTDIPTDEPTFIPTVVPTFIPTDSPTATPTDLPTLLPTASPTQQPSPSPSTSGQEAIYINAGGGDYVDLNGNLWVSDSGFTTGSVSSTKADINNTDNPSLYQTERFRSRLVYTIPLLSGEYNVDLHFAETYFRAFKVGAREFDVSVQGEKVSKKLDIYKEAGDGNTAFILNVPSVIVSDGELIIKLVSVNDKQFAKLSGLEVHATETTSSPTESPTASPTGSPTASPTELPTFLPTITVKKGMEQDVIRINAGGDDYVDPDGNTWMSDKGFFNAGAIYRTSANITNTAMQELYQTERNQPAMTYTIPVTSGLKYTVRLHYAEIFERAFKVDARLFDVFIQGVLVSLDLDIFAEAGNEGYRAYIETTRDVEVDDGLLTIDFIGIEQHAKISGIEIISGDT